MLSNISQITIKNLVIIGIINNQLKPMNSFKNKIIVPSLTPIPPGIIIAINPKTSDINKDVKTSSVLLSVKVHPTALIANHIPRRKKNRKQR